MGSQLLVPRLEKVQLYGEWSYSGSNMRCLNNVFIACQDQPISIGPNGSPTVSDVLVANNLIIDCAVGIYFWGGGNTGSTLSNARCYNNLTINSGNNNIGTISYSGTIAQADNLTSFPTSGFVSYAQGAGTNNNFHLNSTATTAVGQGINLSSDFTFDRDGNHGRLPALGHWAVYLWRHQHQSGAFGPAVARPEFRSGFNKHDRRPRFYRSKLGRWHPLGDSYSIAAIQYCCRGAYSLGAGQSTNVTIRFSPNAVGAFTNTAAFTVAGGSGTTRTASGTGAANNSAPIVTGSLTLQPSAGNITAPFVLSSGYVSQSVTTVPTAANWSLFSKQPIRASSQSKRWCMHPILERTHFTSTLTLHQQTRRTYGILLCQQGSPMRSSLGEEMEPMTR